MKRNAPTALLALAAFVVLPAQTTQTTSLIFSSAPVGIDGDTPGVSGKPVRLNGIDAEEIGHMGERDNRPWLIAAGVALDAVRGNGHQDGPRDGFYDKGQADSAPSDASPHQGALLRSGDGATPVVAGSAARSSVTPTGERTAIASVTTPAVPAVRENEPEPRQIYAGLIKPENTAPEQRCLAEAIYFEARSEGEDGRAAVAQVVLNRVRSGSYPDSVCGVVYQNRHRKLACQFSFACTGKSLRIAEPEPWQEAVRIARDVYEGRIYLEEVGASTHYHADYVRPDWTKRLKRMDAIGRHIFYS